MKPYILFDETIEIISTTDDFKHKHQTIDFYRWLVVNRPDHLLVYEFNGERGAIDINTLKGIVPDKEQQTINKPKRTRKPKKVS